MSNTTYPPLLNFADIGPPAAVASTVTGTSSIGLGDSTTSAAPAATTSSAAPAVTTSSTSAAPATTSSSVAPTTAPAASSTAAAPASSSTAAAATSSARATTAAPTSEARTSSAPVVLVTITSTDSSGAVVTGISSSSAPVSTGTTGASSSGSGSSSNLGAIIGGVAGGVAGLIILIWLILLPLRRRAKKQKEVEWLAFGQENDHVNESSAEALYGRGAGGGGGEGKGGSVANVNEIQMDEMADQPYHYQNVAAHSPQQQQPGQYDAYYGHPQQGYGGPQYQQQMHYPQQQHQAWAGSQPQYSPEAAWGAAPGYVSPSAQSIANHGGLSHSMSVGSKAPAPEQQHYLGSQDGHGQYAGYASPPLGAHSPQQYPQQYQGQPQPYAAAPHNAPDAASQRSGSPQSVQQDRRPGNTGLHLANP